VRQFGHSVKVCLRFAIEADFFPAKVARVKIILIVSVIAGRPLLGRNRASTPGDNSSYYRTTNRMLL
jgi:hypothetical protein